MEPVNNYGKLSRQALITELVEVSATLTARLRELGGLKQDHNNSFYPAYFRAPGNSVASKEREAEYQTQDIINEMGHVEADIEILSKNRELLLFLIPYADGESLA
jgi:hypothetical protein